MCPRTRFAPERVLPLYGAALDELSFGVQIIKNFLVRLWPIVTSSLFVIDAVVAPFYSHNLVGDGQFPGKGKLANKCLAVFAQFDGCTLHCFDTLPMIIPIARDTPRGVTRLRCEAEAAFHFGSFKSKLPIRKCFHSAATIALLRDPKRCLSFGTVPLYND